MRTLRLPSGLYGWQARLREVYDSKSEFEAYCNIYSIHTRLGFTTPQAAWKKNPTIQGSINPADLKRVSPRRLPRRQHNPKQGDPGPQRTQ